MKQFYPLLALMLISFSVSAQYENFDLSKYKLPDIERHQLDFQFNSDGRTSKLYSIYEYGNSTDTTRSKEMDFNWDSNLLYSFYKSNTRSQQKLNTLINYNLMYTERSNSTYKYLDNNGRMEFSYDYKYFIQEEKWFLNAIPGITINTSKENNTHNSDKQKSYSISGLNSLGLGGGFGRIEQVQDFRQAVLIIDEIQKRGMLQRDLTETELTELAHLVSVLKNKRVFDSRKRKERDLIEVNKFLNNKGLISGNDISYFIGLEDMWVYGGLQSRESGNQIKFISSPDYYFIKSGIVDSEPSNNSYTLSLSNNLTYTSKKPVSLKLQRDFEIGLYNNLSKYFDKNDSIEHEKDLSSAIWGNYLLGYYPNTRTYFEISLSGSLSYNDYKRFFENGRFSTSLLLVSKGYYYISERFRIGYELNVRNYQNIIFNKSETNYKNTRMNYLFSLDYAIF